MAVDTMCSFQSQNISDRQINIPQLTTSDNFRAYIEDAFTLEGDADVVKFQASLESENNSPTPTVSYADYGFSHLYIFIGKEFTFISTFQTDSKFQNAFS